MNRRGKPARDLRGQRFGRLEVIERVGTYMTPEGKQKQPYWRCKCDCGNECVVISGNLMSGGTQSCGCLRKGAKHRRYDE